MKRRDALPGSALVLEPFALLILGACFVHLLPAEVQIGLLAWVLASFPIGVLFGHCVSREE